MERPIVSYPPTDQRALPAPTVQDRLAEWQSRGEEFIRERPVTALAIALAAGLLTGRLVKMMLRRDSERREPLGPDD